MTIEITQLSASEALGIVHNPESSLARLILLGYALRPESLGDPVAAASVEYNYPNDRAVVFIARQGELVIGSFTFILWKDKATDKRGGPFWSKLRELDPLQAARADKLNPLACDVGGVVVLPEFRSQNIGQLLANRAIEVIQPSIIVGNTKTVAAVALRRKLSEQGYRTFYIGTEVTQGKEQVNSKTHQSILNAYMHARGLDLPLTPNASCFIYHGDISGDVPDTSSYPPIIKAAFEPLIFAQRRAGAEKTIMGPLLSIRQEILD